MRTAGRFVVLAGFVVAALLPATASSADFIVDDPTLDPPGQGRGSPSVARTESDLVGDQVLVLWTESHPFPGSLFRFADSIVGFNGPLGFVQGGTPPAPAGYRWYHDPIVRTPAPGTSIDGGFYIAGTLEATSGSPLHLGAGFVRGYAQDPNTISFDTPQLISDFGPNIQGGVYINLLAMEVHPVSSVVYLLFSRSIPGGTPHDVYMISSPDGAVWSSPSVLGTDSTSLIGPLRIVCGKNAGDVAFYWGESNYTNPGPTTIKCRTSTDGGVTLGAPAAVMTYPGWQPSDPGDIPFIGEALTSVMDRSGGLYDGTSLFGATIPMDLAADVYPDPATAASQLEIEPNGSATAATSVAAVGAVLRGFVTSSTPADTDCFSFLLSRGQAVSVNCDSVDAANLTVTWLAWIGPDGRSVLTSVFGLPYCQMGFVAPASGRYVLRLAAQASQTSAYRIRTTTSTVPPSGASDARDVAISSISPPGAWTGMRLIMPPDDIGSVQDGLTMQWNLDGALYASYNDYFSRGHALSHRVIRRSEDGGATWSAPAVISGANTDWMQVTIPNNRYFAQGQWCDMASDGIRMFTVWTDGRNGQPDIYLGFTNRRVQSTDATQLTASGRPGDVMHVVCHVQNLDDSEPFDLILSPSTPFAGWTLPNSTTTLAPGETAPVTCTFTIPADATPGLVRLIIALESNLPPFSAYADQYVNLTVLPSSADAGRAPAVLELSPVSPNPLHGAASASYSLSRPGSMELNLYGLDGRLVRHLASGSQTAGLHSAAWDARDDEGNPVAPGAYFLVMRAEGRTLTRRVVYLR